MTFYNASQTDAINEILDNEADSTDWVFYNNTSGTGIYQECSSAYIFTIEQQKLEGDSNDWINVTMLDN